ncbi:EamA family transporter [Amycolatopsis sp. cg9]|uniref:EamA family transporter n=1 Tax=Amycolatopsis sp. cg9 TaxID=3238801 RepID=UPI003523C0BE
MRGVLPLTGFAALTAALDVFAGNQLEQLRPATVAAVSFGLAAVVFLGFALLRDGAAATFRPVRELRGDVVMINVTTAVTWLSMLFALRYLEPAVVNVVGIALGPVLTLVLNPLLRRGAPTLRAEAWVAAGIAVLIGLLVWGSFTGRGALERTPGETLAGVALVLLTGVGSVANVLYSKRLSDAALPPRRVLALRFFLILAVTWVLVAFDGAPGVGAALVPSALIALFGVALPLYLLQVGIERTEPITASILLTLSPLFAYLMQLADHRLTPSGLTLGCVAGIVALVGAGTVARLRHDREVAAVECVPTV